MELEVTWKRTAKVWWSQAWRGIFALLAAILVGAFAGFLLGLVSALVGLSQQAIATISMPLGFIIGLVATIVPVKLILGKDFGEFRLVLLAKDVSHGGL